MFYSPWKLYRATELLNILIVLLNPYISYSKVSGFEETVQMYPFLSTFSSTARKFANVRTSQEDAAKM